MLETLKELDTQLFLYLNHKHSVGWDIFMEFCTDKKAWIPLYAVILIVLFRHFKVRVIFVLIAIGATIACADLFASGFCKPFFERLRPCHEPELEGLVHILARGCGGSFGFISSHAANTFGLATILVLLTKKQYTYVWLFYLWAAIVSYSRIYIGVHYPSDIIVGALSGIMWAYIVFAFYKKLIPSHLR
ncbi:MAG: phosphatase PAP2 family protein [Flammeovirgaceae bacterium]